MPNIDEYFSYIEKLADELPSKTSNPAFTDAYKKEMRDFTGKIDVEELEACPSWILEEIKSTGTETKNHVSLYNLCYIATKSIVRLALSGKLDSSIQFIKFLKYDLFWFSLLNIWQGRNMMLGVYRGGNLGNKELTEASFVNINDFDTYHPTQKVCVDSLHLTYKFARFFLKNDKNGYYKEEDRSYLEDIIKKYETFKEYTYTDAKITPTRFRNPGYSYKKSDPTEWVHEKEAKKFCSEVRPAWPAMAYALYEVYYHYDKRYALAKATVPFKPDIEAPRTYEKPEIERHKKTKKLIGTLIKLLIILAIIGVILYFVLSTPIILLCIVIFGFLALIGSIFGSSDGDFDASDLLLFWFLTK